MYRVDPNYIIFIECDRPIGHIKTMNPEIFNAAFLSFSLIFVGIGGGFLLLKLQGGEE
ncbi:cytochrome b6-f complex subunit PetM [Microcoleus sp. D3_18_C4]|uniref:cytochrome b6-f complex subunit PetM n=1 Tax=Microcoleus sp. D3_18_C4 TaxID=3055335 RepID=UPI0040409E80